MNEKAKELIAQMTIEEKASLCSGLNAWQLKGVERLGLEPITVTDGPHGLRKKAGDISGQGIGENVPATCFPAACATACSFDTQLLNEIGQAMGEECIQEDVAVILGPGVNIKRSPLCGRNFEYFSEDPLLSGELGAALINGVQSQKIGTSLKHYAANEQETLRLIINTIADMRALREIYLKAFEIAVKKAQPWTVMCSYNKIDGVYSADNKWLLTDVLRDDWGFDGLVMTDWGAVNDRVLGVNAGLDLEMPASGGVNDAKIVEAVKNGSLPEASLDAVAQRVAGLILRYSKKPGYKYNAQQHHALARKAAAESCVLLKNDSNILPLKPKARIAVIGQFAKTPRYQGSGSSKINPLKMDNAHDELEKLGFPVTYARGYEGTTADASLIAEAVKAAKDADTAVIFAGLPDEYESEGFDRKSLEMPESHTGLIRAVAEVNPNTVVVLQLGAPVTTGWADCVKGLIVSYLGGQAGGGGIADVLSGIVNPGGRLAETWPLKLEDTPSYKYFPGGNRTVEYRESVYVGYRYYETAQVPVAWPFGFGLSYTSFAYSDITAGGEEVSFTITNTGSVTGAETAQVYLSLPGSKIYRPAKWLAAFEKVRLAPGESKTVHIKIEKQAFEYYNTAAGGWRTEGGTYTVSVGSSVKDIFLTAAVDITGDGDESLLTAQSSLCYSKITGNTFPDTDFKAIYGKPLPPMNRTPGRPYDVNDTLGDIMHTAVGKNIYAQAVKAVKNIGGLAGDDIVRMMSESFLGMPLRSLVMFAGDSVPQDFSELIIGTLNGNIFSRLRGYLRLLTAMKSVKKQ